MPGDLSARASNGQFTREAGGGGRPRGSPNRIARAVREALQEALDTWERGDRRGAAGYFRTLMDEEPAVFAGLVGKFVPIELRGELTRGVELHVIDYSGRMPRELCAPEGKVIDAKFRPVGVTPPIPPPAPPVSPPPPALRAAVAIELAPLGPAGEPVTLAPVEAPAPSLEDRLRAARDRERLLAQRAHEPGASRQARLDLEEAEIEVERLERQLWIHVQPDAYLARWPRTRARPDGTVEETDGW
jgi:hypothetical protein